MDRDRFDAKLEISIVRKELLDALRNWEQEKGREIDKNIDMVPVLILIQDTLNDYLARRLGKPIKMPPSKKFDSLIEALGKKAEGKKEVVGMAEEKAERLENWLKKRRKLMERRKLKEAEGKKEVMDSGFGSQDSLLEGEGSK